MTANDNKGNAQALAMFGVIGAFMLVGGAGYFAGYQSVWIAYANKPRIGAEPLRIKLVEVVSDIASGAKIDYDAVEEKYATLDHISLDSYGFAADCLGKTAKWDLKKGQYIARHDVLPEPQSAAGSDKNAGK